MVWSKEHDLDLYDISCLGALGRFDDVELHLLTFCKRLEAAVLNVAEMNEHVSATFTGNEAKTLGIIEPLHGSGYHGELPPSMKLKMTERCTTKNRKDEKSLRFSQQITSETSGMDDATIMQGSQAFFDHFPA
jgi:hypothetical protein